MGEWQRDELKDAGDDLVYVIAMHEGGKRIASGAPPSPENFERWISDLDFHADTKLLDYGRRGFQRGEILRRYHDAMPPGERNSHAVTVIIDREMRIRRVGSTYDRSHDKNLDVLLELLAE